jgi:hypothetical protein
MNAKRYNTNNRYNNKRSNIPYNNKSFRSYLSRNATGSNNNSRYRKRRQKRSQLSYPRFSYRFRRINPNRQRTDQLSRQISELSKQMSKMSLNSNPTNLNKGKKEPRIDKITTPMNMAIHQSYISLYPSSNKIVYVPIYTKTNFSFSGATSILWFPYAVSFNKFDKIIKVQDESEQYDATAVANLLKLSHNGNQLLVLESGICSLPGSYRLVGATFKIYNTTAMLNKSGDFTIYKLNDSDVLPFAYNDEHPPTQQNLGSLYNDYCKRNFQQATIKNNFSAADKCVYINEFNTNSGNNIFSNNSEYLGDTYLISQATLSAKPSNLNPVGSNIKYMLDFSPTTSSQTYTIEIWQLIELVPYPDTNLGNLCYNITHIYPKKIFDEICQSNPLSKV